MLRGGGKIDIAERKKGRKIFVGRYLGKTLR